MPRGSNQIVDLVETIVSCLYSHDAKYDIIKYLNNRYKISKDIISSTQEVAIVVPDFLVNSSLSKYTGYRLIPLSSNREIPPITFFILKHFYSRNLQLKIIKKAFKKRERDLKIEHLNSYNMSQF